MLWSRPAKGRQLIMHDGLNDAELFKNAPFGGLGGHNCYKKFQPAKPYRPGSVKATLSLYVIPTSRLCTTDAEPVRHVTNNKRRQLVQGCGFLICRYLKSHYKCDICNNNKKPTVQARFRFG